jgi:hypothetical protein
VGYGHFSKTKGKVNMECKNPLMAENSAEDLKHHGLVTGQVLAAETAARLS